IIQTLETLRAVKTKASCRGDAGRREVYSYGSLALPCSLKASKDVAMRCFDGCVKELFSRSAKFIALKEWVVDGANDMFIWVYNYNAMDIVKVIEAHTDYIHGLTEQLHHPASSRSVTNLLLQLKGLFRTAEDDLEVFSTDDLDLNWIYAHNFLTYLQKLSSYTSGHFEVSELAACLEKLHFPALLVMSKFSRI
ncbi:coatomer subunit beta'-1-like protein isoform X3, partial [Tanacetum coccineum]